MEEVSSRALLVEAVSMWFSCTFISLAALGCHISPGGFLILRLFFRGLRTDLEGREQERWLVLVLLRAHLSYTLEAHFLFCLELVWFGNFLINFLISIS